MGFSNKEMFLLLFRVGASSLTRSTLRGNQCCFCQPTLLFTVLCFSFLPFPICFCSLLTKATFISSTTRANRRVPTV
ncbi:hypothetical protein CDL12_05353 [Handroanthus impetiginosus]|uniref:Uncharacterized protein n=1 Tax=Handroanthus impetiginosus TaxID=429701 RepID=A0A2G9HX86_9LAMI|nr:hypothetical protein CDL12_05353 [Handroanthus impetiginosus]